MDKEKDLSIEALQKRLDDLGVRDIKVFWSKNIEGLARVDLEKELSLILNSYLDGYCEPLELLGDKPPKPVEYTLVSDNDGHEYVIPLDRVEDWYVWLNSENYEDGIDPPYAERKEGFIAFTGYRLDK